MNSIQLCNRKCLQIISDKLKNEIMNKLEKLWQFDFNKKSYYDLRYNNLDLLKKNDYLITLNTFGKKFLLYLTTIQYKKYSFFIDIKTHIIYSVLLTFNPELYDTDTLFQGEMILKTEHIENTIKLENCENKRWMFAICDLLVYNRNNMRINSNKQNLKKRLDIVKNILKYDFTETNKDICPLTLKTFFEYKNLEDMCSTDYRKTLKYKTNAVIFQNCDFLGNNYIFKCIISRRVYKRTRG